MIKKLSPLTLKKLLICAIITVISIIFIGISFSHINDNSSDDTSYTTLNGTITDIKDEMNAGDYYSGSTTEVIELENGDTISIGIGGRVASPIGSEVTVYTDGTHYALSSQGIAANNNGSIFYFILIIILSFFLVVLWTSLFKIRGLIFIIILLLLVCLR